MRIATLTFFDRATQSILDQQAKLSKTQQQIATGRRILTPSDDPSGAARSLDLKRYIETREQYQDNIGTARSRLELQETTLDAATRLLQRSNELAIQGNNASVDAAGREALAEEVDQLLDELLSLANTKDSNGEYLFSGYQRDTQPFIDAGAGAFQYQGDQGQRLIRISDERQIGDAETGLEIFMDIQASTGGTQDVFTTLHELAQGLRAGVDLSDSINDVQLAMEKTLEMRTRAGARLKTVEEQEQVNADYILSLETQLSNIQDLDFAEAITRLNLQATALEAAQQSFVRVQNLSLFSFLR